MQVAFDDIGERLDQVTFVIVDLETTGGPSRDAGITEVGAVKVRGGERIGTFATLVNPQRDIPPFIATLTGITNALVAQAPTLTSVLPAFLEFAHDAVLVAHNAPYDIGFLKGACAQLGYEWPQPIVVDTARLARVALQPGEVRNCKLATLAAFVRAETQPIHRALADAQATTDVLHYLIGRIATFGVHTLPDLRAFSSNVSRAQRTKRHLAEGMPPKPGVYIFEDAQGSALYIGTSRNIASRVRSYFTASEQRRRMADMIAIAERVRPVVCETALEAQIREVRLITQHQPRYNRRSRRADRKPWLKLTTENSPRLSIVRGPHADDDALYLGPFGGRVAAQTVMETMQFAFNLRTCTTKLAAQPKSATPGCVLAELGRCVAPCTADHNRDAYVSIVEQVRATMLGDTRALQLHIHARIKQLALEERFEEAAVWRDRLLATLNAVLRSHQRAMVWRNALIVAAEPTDDGGWDIHAISHGALIGAKRITRGADPKPTIDALVAMSATMVERSIAELAEETALIGRWLTKPGVRLVQIDEPLTLPRHCGGTQAAELASVRTDMRWPDGERGLRPTGPADAHRFSRISLAG